MTLPDLVVGHLNPSAKLRQDHYLDVLVFKVKRLIGFVRRLVRNLLDDGVRIDDAAAALINAFFEEHGILFGSAYFIGRYDNLLFPDFYFHCYKE